MPAGSFLAAALQAASPPSQMAQRLREATTAASSSSGDFSNFWGDDDSDDDDAAEAIIAEHRARRELAQKEAEEDAKAEAEAQAEVDAFVAHEHLGFAGRVLAMKRAQAKQAQAKQSKLAELAHAKVLAERLQITVMAQVLTDIDVLSVVLASFEQLFLGDVPTEGGFQRYTALAGVCTQWRAAIGDALRSRCVLRHAHMFVDGPKCVHNFSREPRALPSARPLAHADRRALTSAGVARAPCWRRASQGRPFCR